RKRNIRDPGPCGDPRIGVARKSPSCRSWLPALGLDAQGRHDIHSEQHFMQRLTDTAAPAAAEGVAASAAVSDLGIRVRRAAEYIVVPLFALSVSAALFSLFLLAVGKSP